MKKQFLLIGSLLCSSMVFGQAYQLNVQGIRQQAMGGTGAAIPWDASTVFYNPAGMDAMETPQVYASMNLMMPRTRYISAPTGTSNYIHITMDLRTKRHLKTASIPEGKSIFDRWKDCEA